MKHVRSIIQVQVKLLSISNIGVIKWRMTWKSSDLMPKSICFNKIYFSKMANKLMDTGHPWFMFLIFIFQDGCQSHHGDLSCCQFLLLMVSSWWQNVTETAFFVNDSFFLHWFTSMAAQVTMEIQVVVNSLFWWFPLDSKYWNSKKLVVIDSIFSS